MDRAERWAKYANLAHLTPQVSASVLDEVTEPSTPPEVRDQVGLALKRQKERLPHGMFGRWIEAEFGMSDAYARAVMSIAATYEGKTLAASGLGFNALRELASPSTPPEVRDQVGLALKRQKERLKGTFHKWIEVEFGMSERTAQNFMRVAEVYGNGPATVAGLGTKALYELAAPSTPPEVRDQVGLALKRQKERLPHGMFGPWIADEFSMSDQTARNFIRVADLLDGKSKTVLNLPVTALYELAAPSTPPEVRDQVEALVISSVARGCITHPL